MHRKQLYIYHKLFANYDKFQCKKNTVSTYLGLEILIRRCKYVTLFLWILFLPQIQATQKNTIQKTKSQLIVMICLQMDERWFQTTIPLLSKLKTWEKGMNRCSTLDTLNFSIISINFVLTIPVLEWLETIKIVSQNTWNWSSRIWIVTLI